MAFSREFFATAGNSFKSLLSQRGPDYMGEELVKIGDEDDIIYYISLTSTVLALRGGKVIVQPFKDVSSGSVFCWNGEAWKFDAEPVEGNDGQVVFELLSEAVSSQKSTAESTAEVLRVLRSISGPFAFVLLDKVHGMLYFGRDRLGRRSLLYNADASLNSVELASSADPMGGIWKEVEADGIYQISFTKEQAGFGQSCLDDSAVPPLPLHRHIWDDLNSNSPASLGIFNRTLPASHYALTIQTPSVGHLKQHLCESLKLRILNVPNPPGPVENRNVRIAILFSGGLDCTVLARMAHDLLPTEQQIDLINVAFENPRVVEAAKKTLKFKKQATYDIQDTSRVNPQDDGAPCNEVSVYEACPDRKTGRQSFRELQNICTGRIWRFVAVDVPYSELIAHRATVVGLIRPHNTEMDLSIASALYFASRGTGTAVSSVDDKIIAYTTPARVLLSGLGADELFGGYTRHTTAFNRNGFPALLDEMELDVNRLGKRNLGRDDRVISHWSREVRFPYLDETLVKWAVESPIWEKCEFYSNIVEESEIPELEPGKKVLRLLAYNLGMHSVAQEKKRAIQFGARTAKMEVGRTKGTSLIS